MFSVVLLVEVSVEAEVEVDLEPFVEQTCA
jgi:hypothetical protein